MLTTTDVGKNQGTPKRKLCCRNYLNSRAMDPFNRCPSRNCISDGVEPRAILSVPRGQGRGSSDPKAIVEAKQHHISPPPLRMHRQSLENHGQTGSLCLDKAMNAQGRAGGYAEFVQHTKDTWKGHVEGKALTQSERRMPSDDVDSATGTLDIPRRTEIDVHRMTS